MVRSGISLKSSRVMQHSSTYQNVFDVVEICFDVGGKVTILPFYFFIPGKTCKILLNVSS